MSIDAFSHSAPTRAPDRPSSALDPRRIEPGVELRREWKVERRLTWAIDHPAATGRQVATPHRDVDAALRRGRLLAERHAILAAVPADPSAAIRAAERELDGLRRRRADLETGRGHYANHPINRAVLDHQQAQANVARLRANVESGRLPRRERREKEAELARWRVRHAAAAKDLDDLAAPERRRLDRAEANVVGRLSSLHEQRERRDSWFAGHPEAARRLDGIERDVETINLDVERPSRAVTAERGVSRDLPWLRDPPVIDRGLDLGLGL